MREILARLVDTGRFVAQPAIENNPDWDARSTGYPAVILQVAILPVRPGLPDLAIMSDSAPGREQLRQTTCGMAMAQ
jgi:hypothetical protein